MYAMGFASIALAILLLRGGVFCLERPDLCLLPPLDDDCGAEQQNRWFFSDESESCVQFVFRGCGTSPNNFATMEECQRVCLEGQGQGREVDISTASAEATQLHPGENMGTTFRIPEATNEENKSEFQINENQQTTKTISGESKNVAGAKPTPAQTKENASESFPFADTGNSHEQNESEGEKPENHEAFFQSPTVQENVQTSFDSKLNFNSNEQAIEFPVENDQDSKSGILEGQIISSEREENGNQGNAPAEDQREIRSKENADLERNDHTRFRNTSEEGQESEMTTSPENKIQPVTFLRGHSDPATPDQSPKQTPMAVTSLDEPRTQTEAGERKEGTTTSAFDALVASDAPEGTERTRLVAQTGKSEVIVTEVPTSTTRPTEALTNTVDTGLVSRLADRAEVSRSRSRTASVELLQRKDFKQGHENTNSSEIHEFAGSSIEISGNNNTAPMNSEDSVTLPPSDVTSSRMTSHTTEFLKRANQKPASKHVTPPAPAMLDNKQGFGSVSVQSNQSVEIDDTPPVGENRTTATGLTVQSPVGFRKQKRGFQRPTTCSLHHIRGHCAEDVNRWFFDPVSEACLPFVYSGCGGNANNYETLSKCLVTCTGKTTERSGTRRGLHGNRNRQPILSRPMRYASLDLVPDSNPVISPQRLALHFLLGGIKRNFLKPPESFLNSPIALPLKTNSVDDDAEGHETIKDRKIPVESAEKQFPEDRIEAKELATKKLKTNAPNKAENRDEKYPTVNERVPGNEDSGQGTEKYLGNFPEFQKYGEEKLPRNPFNDPVRAPEFPGMTEISRNSRPNPLERDDMKAHELRRQGFNPRNRPGERENTGHAEDRPRWNRDFRNPSPGSEMIRNAGPNGRPDGLKELRNFGWVEQTIFLSDLPPARFNLPHLMDRKLEPNWIPGPMRGLDKRPETGHMDDPAKAVVLRRNTFIVETRPRTDIRRDKVLPPHPIRTGSVRYRAQPRPEIPKKFPSSSIETSLRRFPVKDLERAEPEIESHRHAFPPVRPFKVAERPGIRRPEVEPRRRADLQRTASENGSRDPSRFRKNESPRNRHQQDRELAIPSGRDYGFSPRRRGPLEQFTFLQIFMDRDHPRRPQPPMPETPVDGPRDSGERTFDSQIEEILSKNKDSTLRSNRLEHSGRPQNSPSSPAICQLPPDFGSCRFYQPKWFFDQDKESCEIFYFGGCGGSENGFETMEDCLKACKEETENAELKPEDDESDVKIGESDSQFPENADENVIVFTSPVYGEEKEEDPENRGRVKVGDDVIDHVVRPVTKTYTPSGDDVEKRTTSSMKTNDNEQNDSLGKATTITATATEGEVGDESDMTKSFSVQYIVIVTTLGVVGLAIVLMVIVSIARLCKRARKSKREHSIQEVIKTHIYGDLPQGLYSESPTTSSSAASSSSKITEKEEKLEKMA